MDEMTVFEERFKDRVRTFAAQHVEEVRGMAERRIRRNLATGATEKLPGVPAGSDLHLPCPARGRNHLPVLLRPVAELRILLLLPGRPGQGRLHTARYPAW